MPSDDRRNNGNNHTNIIPTIMTRAALINLYYELVNLLYITKNEDIKKAINLVVNEIRKKLTELNE